jgi:hypothetical protein
VRRVRRSTPFGGALAHEHDPVPEGDRFTSSAFAPAWADAVFGRVGAQAHVDLPVGRRGDLLLVIRQKVPTMSSLTGALWRTADG